MPPPARHLIERGRLYDVLDEGVGQGVVLLSAPAGAGKTVLLSSWIAARELPGRPCWLSLDADDNDPVRLLDDLLSTLRRPGDGVHPTRGRPTDTTPRPGDGVHPTRGRPTDTTPRPGDGVHPTRGRRADAPPPGDGQLDALVAPTGGGTERFLALLVNALAELPAPLVLVLDEVHELTSPRATAALDYLVRHAPPQLRIVLAGRADPPLHIERLRAGGALTELRIAELAFSREETAALCGELELEIPEEQLQALWTHTEGWPAAVRLAAVSLREHPEPARFLADFAGTDRAIADYLISEVLARLPAETREFMLHTCIVDAVSPELADALTGGEGGTLPLAELERMGAPVQPATVDGRWYRYHPLFGELLRAHLRHAHPEQIPELHRRAARWCAEQHQAMPAIRHALAGEDWELTGGLIDEHWLELFLHGGAAAMRGPLAQLPPAVVAADPRLAAALAGTRLQEGDLGDAERLLGLARESREPPRELLVAVALRHARLRVRPDDAARLATELSAAAHEQTHRSRTALRAFALCDLGATLLWSGADLGAAETHFDEALALASEHRHDLIALDCLAQLAVVHVLRGELTRGERLGTRAVELAERHGWCEEPAAAAAHLAAGTCAYRRGEFERAEGLLARAAAAGDTAEPPVRLTVSLMQAYSLAAAGERSAAAGALKLGAIRSELADGVPAPAFLERVLDGAEPRVLMAAGEVEQARATLAAALQRRPDSVALLVRQASFELRDGEPELARASLARARAVAAEHRPSPSPGTVLESWVLQAVAERACGDQPAASQALDQALALAEREPFRDAFLLNGPAVRELLEMQAREGTAHPALLEVLLDGVGAAPADGATLAEPLTEREQRILRYLPTMLTNAEIGAEVFVSLNTVKTHLRSIYRKLDVSGRADAVEKARRLGLLPAGIKRPRVVQRV